MVTSTTDLEKRLEQLKQAVPTRGMERHPTILKDISELPAELQSPDLTASAARENIREIISFPQQIQRGHHYVPKQALLFTSTGIVHMLASVWPGQEPSVTFIQADSLIYLMVTLILLYGFLEIVAESATSPTRLAVEFNTVAWDQIVRPVRQFLQAARNAPAASTENIPYPAHIQPAVDALPLKYFNGVRIYGVLPGEKLEELVFQPPTWERRLMFFSADYPGQHPDFAHQQLCGRIPGGIGSSPGLDPFLYSPRPNFLHPEQSIRKVECTGLYFESRAAETGLSDFNDRRCRPGLGLALVPTWQPMAGSASAT